MQQISITELEGAINYYKELHPVSKDSPILRPETRALADVYALLIFRRESSIPLSALNTAQQAVLAEYFRVKGTVAP
jgi:uncharacterized protein